MIRRPKIGDVIRRLADRGGTAAAILIVSPGRDRYPDHSDHSRSFVRWEEFRVIVLYPNEARPGTWDFGDDLGDYELLAEVDD